ncbi:hypothetical protein DEO72_LG6g1518 [Vigna unguiculata]|uniref:Uncharacterized protein n=1 Tax=Vigna unguiculata TaxID=3917 RepID=A0A4D6M8H1_VIGUN|nr:hypothetical protein DEO72_LG6g1518 [Vigna unguiculata]
MAKQRNRHSLVDHENLAHLLPSTKLMIIARKNSHIQHNHATKRAEGSRSAETYSLTRAPPSPRRGLEKEAEALAGSRLGETPLAWARCSLAQKHMLDTVFTCNRCEDISQATIPPYHTSISTGRVNGSPDSTIASTIFPRTAKELENSGGTEPRGIYYEALTGHNAKENTYRLEGHLRGVGTGFELARRGP